MSLLKLGVMSLFIFSIQSFTLRSGFASIHRTVHPGWSQQQERIWAIATGDPSAESWSDADRALHFSSDDLVISKNCVRFVIPGKALNGRLRVCNQALSEYLQKMRAKYSAPALKLDVFDVATILGKTSLLRKMYQTKVPYDGPCHMSVLLEDRKVTALCMSDYFREGYSPFNALSKSGEYLPLLEWAFDYGKFFSALNLLTYQPHLEADQAEEGKRLSPLPRSSRLSNDESFQTRVARISTTSNGYSPLDYFFHTFQHKGQFESLLRAEYIYLNENPNQKWEGGAAASAQGLARDPSSRFSKIPQDVTRLVDLFALNKSLVNQIIHQLVRYESLKKGPGFITSSSICRIDVSRSESEKAEDSEADPIHSHTLLHLAATYLPRAIPILLELKVDPSIRDSMGKLPIDILDESQPRSGDFSSVLAYQTALQDWNLAKDMLSSRP